MATVMHGRRKGTQKAETGRNAGLNCNSLAKNNGMTLPDGTDLRQVTVLSKQDWERIERELNRKQLENELARRIHEEKEEQKRRSKEIIKNWPNTIAGLTQRKLEARRIREEKEEEERKQIDIEEAKFQAQKRKEAIDKAKTKQYYQTDRVKNFHSALIMTEVLKERDAQLELKRLKEFAMKELDKNTFNTDKEFYEKSIQADQEKARLCHEAAKRTAEFQLAQIQEHLTNEEKDKLDDLKEGEELKKLAGQFHIEKERLDNMRKEERRRMMKENVQQIEDSIAIKHLQEQEEEEEDEECRVFAAAKRKMMQLRAQKEIDIYNDKQVRLERIKDKLITKLKQKINDEEDRLGNAVEENEKKRLEQERAKEEKLLKEIREQAEHRMKQMKYKEDIARQEKQEELELLQMRNAADELFKQNENEKSIQRRQNAEQIKNTLIDQYNERVNKNEEIKKVQLALDKANEELLKMEEVQFQEYAKKVIEHCKEKGRNVYPLERAAQRGIGGSPSVVKPANRSNYLVSDKSGKQLPNYQCDSTDQTKLQINGKATSKNRLGFMW